MSNLGYFQLKAGPGVYNLSLAPGRSKMLYNVIKAGPLQSMAEVIAMPKRDLQLSGILKIGSTSITPPLNRGLFWLMNSRPCCAIILLCILKPRLDARHSDFKIRIRECVQIPKLAHLSLFSVPLSSFLPIQRPFLSRISIRSQRQMIAVQNRQMAVMHRFKSTPLQVDICHVWRVTSLFQALCIHAALGAWGGTGGEPDASDSEQLPRDQPATDAAKEGGICGCRCPVWGYWKRSGRPSSQDSEVITCSP